MLKLCCVLSVLVCGLFGSSATAAERPNVVVILSDDQAWFDYGFMGHPEIETPHLDRLAESGALYTRGYVPTALCRPSLATIVSGRYAHEHGISGNDPASLAGADRARVISLLDELPTLPKLLGEAGYVSFQSGKWWEGDPVAQGFTAGMTRGFPKPQGRHGDDGLVIGREGMEPVFSFIEGAQAAEKPFFVWYAPFLPHTPHNPPQRLLDKYLPGAPSEAVAKYRAMCDWFDETCGELLGYLDDEGLSEDMLVVYVCDNGWVTPGPDDYLPEGWKNAFAPRSKQSPYEAGIRTPIILRWPGHTKALRDEGTLASSIDLMPTILAACGVDAPAGLPGINLLPHASGEAVVERDTLYGEIFAHDMADVARPVVSLRYRWCIEGPWKLLLAYDGKLGRYVKTHDWDTVGVKLFHLLDDPHETRSLARENPEVVARLRGKIEAWWPLPADAPKVLGE